MTGASVLRTLGPLGRKLEEYGFTLVAPNAPHRMAGAEVNRASQVLGLTARNGFTQPPEPSFDPFRRFVVVEPDAA